MIFYINEGAILINEGLFHKKKKKRENQFTKNNGIITKDEYNKCVSIVKSNLSKTKIIKNYIEFYDNGYHEYTNEINDDDEFEFAFIYKYNTDIFDNTDEGKKERKSKGYHENYDKFMSYFNVELRILKNNINNDIKSLGLNIEFYIEHIETTEFFFKSNKPKDE